MNTDIDTPLEDVSNQSLDTSELSKSSENTPKRITAPLELHPNSDKADIARKQLENLTKRPRKRFSPTPLENENNSISSATETVEAVELNTNSQPISEVLYSGKPTMTNLSSAIITKEELENEIRKKIAKPEASLPTLKKISTGEIEIPQELILSELTAAPAAIKEDNVEIATETQLDGQELIDILEGKPEEEEGEMYEVYNENGMFIVKSENKFDQNQTTSYEIISTEDEKMAATKQKLLEREIAMRQIASMPTRKNRKLKQASSSSPATTVKQQQQPTLAQTLAMEWSDDKEEEVIFELENVVEEKNNGEPKIKILNMTILNEASEEVKPRVVQKQSVNMKAEPKILNKNAPKNNPPKILNINAPQVSTIDISTTNNDDSTQKRGRVIKKKTIWDPSEMNSISQPQNKLPISLPSTITIKKLTKESITKNSGANTATIKTTPLVETQIMTPTKRGKKKSEIDKLFQDEGAVNMIYSLERQNNNQDVPEIKVNVDQKSLVDKSEEKSTLIAKTKTIKQTIMKQSTSPPEVKTTPTRPQRIKRDLTPNIPESESEKKPSSHEKTEKAVIITKVQKPASSGRKKKTDDTWDFVRKAQTTCDDAMIIRRHSNSSYSSSATSPRRLSLDQIDVNDETNKNADQKSSFKFTKPQEKKTPELQKDLKSCVGGLVEELRNTLSNKLAKGKNVNSEKISKGKKRIAITANQESPPAKRLSERRSHGNEKEYQISKENGIAHLILNANPLSINLLSEVKSLLSQLENDDACKVVLITPSESFSQGLDYSTLIQTTVDKRKQAASDLVTAVKNFLISLAAFPKILACGLKGVTSGIGVTMLPLFDFVIVDSTAKFSLPHIGSNPEGISLLRSSNKINKNAITELFYFNETINANTALSYGLVSKVIPNTKVPKNIEEEVKDVCKTVSSLSSQVLESTKKLLSEDFLIEIDQQLSKEMKILQQQWISAELQEKFKKHFTAGN